MKEKINKIKELLSEIESLADSSSREDLLFSERELAELIDLCDKACVTVEMKISSQE
jgi:hypothetical protein